MATILVDIRTPANYSTASDGGTDDDYLYGPNHLGHSVGDLRPFGRYDYPIWRKTPD
jgi:hypothetical protein